ncbi:hypothetical protein [Leptospirillum ferriphilum]|uniref:hypothetical protein n=1 Tax=Leptospirillum ferriphilum TaxID=178606 RepID=UPI000AD6B98F|nr:hypothetical protein [Leptospirillum ferriphilum]
MREERLDNDEKSVGRVHRGSTGQAGPSSPKGPALFFRVALAGTLSRRSLASVIRKDSGKMMEEW